MQLLWILLRKKNEEEEDIDAMRKKCVYNKKLKKRNLMKRYNDVTNISRSLMVNDVVFAVGM